jgi:hypothetical protein
MKNLFKIIEISFFGVAVSAACALRANSSMNDDFFSITLSACQCRGRVSRLEATGAQRRKVSLLIFRKNFNSYSYSATPFFSSSKYEAFLIRQARA